MPRGAAVRPLDPRTTSPAVTTELLAWYDRHRRALPWRSRPGERPDPYAVWLSEIMLQQTTVAAVKPYYAKFLARWPTVAALADAPTEAVMQAWAGLGYYSRARNLHACAGVVVREHGGCFPDTEADLRTLPGIGAYTAAAIAAIAFGRRAVAVDGNVERVMARLHAVATPLPKARPALASLMDAVTPADRAGDFAQATMDLGATICTPRRPACAICPLLAHCAAARLGSQGDFPRRMAKAATPLRHGVATCVMDEAGAVLVRTRPAKGLLGGMTELPGTAWATVPQPPPAPALRSGEVLAGRIVHTFTHFTLHLDVLLDRRSSIAAWPDCRWIGRAALEGEAFPTLMRNALALALATADEAIPRNPPR